MVTCIISFKIWCDFAELMFVWWVYICQSEQRAKMVSQWVSPHISGSNIGAPIEFAHNILYMSVVTELPYNLILRAAIHKINALREALGQRMGKFLLKTIIALYEN